MTDQLRSVSLILTIIIILNQVIFYKIGLSHFGDSCLILLQPIFSSIKVLNNQINISNRSSTKLFLLLLTFRSSVEFSNVLISLHLISPKTKTWKKRSGEYLVNQNIYGQGLFVSNLQNANVQYICKGNLLIK